MTRFQTFICFVALSLGVAAQSSFSFHINGQTPNGFTEALQTAGENWTRHIHVGVPIKVNVYIINTNLVPFSGLTLANGRQNFVNAPVNDVLYPTALANQLAGSETNPGEYDMDIYFNLYNSFYYGTGKPPAFSFDFITLAMHEIGHGLGFYSDGYVNNSGIGSFGDVPASALAPLSTSFPWRGQDSVPSIFDIYIVKQSGNHLTTCAPPNSVALGDSIKMTASYFSGPLFANASHNNTPLRLAGGNGYFSFGEDLLHLHHTFQNTIMSYGWGTGDTVRVPAPHELAILKELGWKKSTVGLGEREKSTEVSIYPNPSQNSFVVEGQNIRELRLINTAGQLVRSEPVQVGEKKHMVGTGNFAHGFYTLKITLFSGEVLTRKVVLD